MGFGGRDPRPDDHPPRGPERSARSRRPADQDVPRPTADGWRDREPDRDGGWSLLDPVRPDPLGSDRAEPDLASDAPWYDRGRDARPGAVREDRYDDRVRGRVDDRVREGGPDGRTDNPRSYRRGEFDRSWSDGLSGSADDRGAPHDRVSGRRAAPDRSTPIDGGRAPERRPQPAYGDDRYGPADAGPGRFGPDDTRRRRHDADDRGPAVPERTATVGTDGRWAPRPEPRDPGGRHPETGWPPRTAPAPEVGPGPDGYGYSAPPRNGHHPEPAHDRGMPDGGYDGYARNGRSGRHGPQALAGDGTDPRGRGDLTVVDGRGPGPAAYAPDGPIRTRRHGAEPEVPDGFGPEGFDGDGYNLDGLGRDGYGRDGFDLNGFDREGYDRDGFDRDGYDRDGYPEDAYDYDRDDDATGDDPRDYGYAAGYGPDGYRPGRTRVHDDLDHEGYDGYDDTYAGSTERTLAGGEMPLLDGGSEDAAESDELGERRSRRARRASGEKTRRRWPWVVGAAAVAGAVAVPVGMSLLGSSDEGSGTRDAPLLSGSSGTAGLGASGAAQSAAPGAPGGAAAGQVSFEVNGTGKAGSVTFGRGQAVAQAQDVALPFKQDSPAAQEASDYTLTAVSDGGGELSCRIVVNGAVIAEDSAKKGDYSAVSCTGHR